MMDDEGKWNFTDDEQRRLAIEAEADSKERMAEHEASAKSKWWIVMLVLVICYGAVQLAEAITGNKASSLIDLTVREKSK